MIGTNPPLPDRDRLLSAIGAIALPALLLYALVVGLAVQMPTAIDDGLALFGIAAEPPPPPKVRIEPAGKRIKRPEGAAAPPNLRSEATEIEAPPPVVPITTPPPVISAPVAALGADATSGAAPIPGPGTGAGGIGNGRGSGGDGDGDGGGWADETPPRWLRGRLRDSDFPRDVGEEGIGGTVSVRYVVRPDGRVSDCQTTRSSGSRILDDTTCRLITQRFRYAPSRDARGRPVPATIVEDHSWINELGAERSER
jgi:protein TonB